MVSGAYISYNAVLNYSFIISWTDSDLHAVYTTFTANSCFGCSEIVLCLNMVTLE